MKSTFWTNIVLNEKVHVLVFINYYNESIYFQIFHLWNMLKNNGILAKFCQIFWFYRKLIKRQINYRNTRQTINDNLILHLILITTIMTICGYDRDRFSLLLGLFNRDRTSAVGTITRHGMNGMRFESLQCSYLFLGPSGFLFSGYQSSLSIA